MIVFLTVMNLRGIGESASVLAYPVYLFVGSVFLLIIAGVIKVILHGAHGDFLSWI